MSAPAQLADPKDPKRSRVQAVVAGFGTPAASKTVSLVVNGKTVATRKVDVPANGRATVEFEPLDVPYGFNRCEVRIEGGAMRFLRMTASVFAVRRSDPERVLFVHRRERHAVAALFWCGTGGGGAGFVRAAVDDGGADDGSRSDEVCVRGAVGCVTLPSIFEHTLAQYVSKGGSVLIARARRQAHHARIPLWGGMSTDAHYYVAQWRRRDGRPGGLHASCAEQAQPGRDNGGWAETKFFYAAVVDPGQARVAARLSDGTPLLLDKQIGRGACAAVCLGVRESDQRSAAASGLCGVCGSRRRGISRAVSG